jgi:hypothetical protein
MSLSVHFFHPMIFRLLSTYRWLLQVFTSRNCLLVRNIEWNSKLPIRILFWSDHMLCHRRVSLMVAGWNQKSQFWNIGMCKIFVCLYYGHCVLKRPIGVFLQFEYFVQRKTWQPWGQFSTTWVCPQEWSLTPAFTPRGNVHSRGWTLSTV